MAIYYAGKCLSHDSVTAANLTGYQSDAYSLHKVLHPYMRFAGNAKSPQTSDRRRKSLVGGWLGEAPCSSSCYLVRTSWRFLFDCSLYLRSVEAGEETMTVTVILIVKPYSRYFFG